MMDDAKYGHNLGGVAMLAWDLGHYAEGHFAAATETNRQYWLGVWSTCERLFRVASGRGFAGFPAREDAAAFFAGPVEV